MLFHFPSLWNSNQKKITKQKINKKLHRYMVGFSLLIVVNSVFRISREHTHHAEHLFAHEFTTHSCHGFIVMPRQTLAFVALLQVIYDSKLWCS